MARKPARAAKASSATSSAKRLYTLDVHLANGPVTEDFVKKNPKVVRTFQILGTQTLEDLHEAIFEAFGRDDPHMYEFQFGKRPHDRNAKRYVMPEALEPMFGDEPEADGAVDETTLDSLGLKVRGTFLYWFDFGDDWWHQIKVTAIEDAPTKGKFPKLVGKIGDDPPQYPDLEEEEDEE